MIRVASSVLIVFGLFVQNAFGQVITGNGQSLEERAYVNVDFVGVSSSQGDQDYVYSDIRNQETAAFASSYTKLPTAKGLAISGGVHLTPTFGVGLRYTPTSYEYKVGLGISIPHPLLFNKSATDGSTTADLLKRDDQAIDVSAVYFVPLQGALSIRVFGGPTFFKVSQEMVSDISYSQVFSLSGTNVVTITTYDAEVVEKSGVGFHAGGDVAYFFNDHIGVGGTVSFSRGSVEVEEPLSLSSVKLKAGKTLFGGGLRLRF